MKLISWVLALSAVALLGPALLQGAAAEDAATAKAALKDAKGQDVGVASFTQTPAGVLIRLSVRLERRPGTKNSKPERAGSKSYRVFSRLERTILDVQNAPRSQ